MFFSSQSCFWTTPPGTQPAPKYVRRATKSAPKCCFTAATAHLTGLKKVALQTTVFTQRIRPPAPNQYFYAADRKRARIPSDPGLQSAVLSLQEALRQKVRPKTLFLRSGTGAREIFSGPPSGRPRACQNPAKYQERPARKLHFYSAFWTPFSRRKSIFGPPEGGPKGHVDFGPNFREGPFSAARAHCGPPAPKPNPFNSAAGEGPSLQTRVFAQR